MRQDLKKEALEQIEKDIKIGFETEDELLESISEMFYNHDDFDEKWLKEIIADKYAEHKIESLSWSMPGDFQRLTDSFDELIKQKIVCIHNAGFTLQDGMDSCKYTIETLSKSGIKTVGYCFYHSQDIESAIDSNSRTLFLGFGSTSHNDAEAIKVANKIIATLIENSFEINWNGMVNQRIEIKNINWQKFLMMMIGARRE
ncbi:MAG TPA: hypothetical protein VE978_18255 [Chitinophagales bacterium]|nr:hypothetical protein [Chitinophagales bacterium]